MYLQYTIFLLLVFKKSKLGGSVEQQINLEWSNICLINSLCLYFCSLNTKTFFVQRAFRKLPVAQSRSS